MCVCVCAEEDEDAERREGKCVKGGRRVDTPGIVVGEQHTEHAPAVRHIDIDIDTHVRRMYSLTDKTPANQP